MSLCLSVCLSVFFVSIFTTLFDCCFLFLLMFCIWCYRQYLLLRTMLSLSFCPVASLAATFCTRGSVYAICLYVSLRRRFSEFSNSNHGRSWQVSRWTRNCDHCPFVCDPLSVYVSACTCMHMRLRVKGCVIARYAKLIAELRSITWHVGSHIRHRWMHSAITPTRQVGTRFTYTRGMKGWVDLGVSYMLRWFTCAQTVTDSGSTLCFIKNRTLKLLVITSRKRL